MIITCPKCGTSFKVHEDVVPVYGRKMRCSNCGEVWLVKREEQKPEEIVPEKFEPKEKQEPTFEKKEEKTPAKDFGDVYSRLTAKSESIENEYVKMSAFKKFLISFKKKTGLDSRFNRLLFYVSFLGIIVLGLLQFRFDIVRQFPVVAQYYNLLGIKVVATGYGLEFKNISRSEMEIGGKNFIVIKGFINNDKNQEIAIPKLLVQMFDVSGNLIKDFVFDMKESKLAASDQFPFEVLIEKQKSFVKYIIVTFTE